MRYFADFWCAYASFNKTVWEKKKMRLRKVDFPEVFRWNWKENYGACFAIIIWYSLKPGITDSSISSIFDENFLWKENWLQPAFCSVYLY